MIYRFTFARVLVLLLIAPTLAPAYELGTHARLTQAAINRSTLSDPQFVVDLGLDAGDLNPFGDVYYDVSGSTVQTRSVDSFETKFIPLPSSDMLTLPAWLMRGAIREDDIPGSPFLTDDPVNAVRVLNHFYDPVYKRPLTVVGALGKTAPNWAVGATDAFLAPTNPESGRLNHFTVFDAREAMYRALTGRDVSGNPIAATEAERNKYWATTFRALGDVVHLVQDMGQPQHTRNDPHSGIPGGGHKSVYELYIEGMATQEGFRTPSGGIVPLKSVVYGDYPVPQFSSFSAYFSTWPKDSGILDRKGLADYSNRSFFSAGKNADSTEYPYPLGFGLTVQALDVDWLGGTVPLGKATVLLADLPDSLGNPTALKVPLATESMWDQFLETNTGKKTYTLTKKNYDAMADLLIPRAVAYSAGIINYFFRGKLDFLPDPTNPGKYVIKNLGPEEMSGDFTLYYDAVDGKRYAVAGDTPTKTWAGRSIAKDGQLGNLSFSVPTNPAPEVPGKYMLVFNGDMGEEKAIPGSTIGAVAAKYVEPERTGFLIQPNFTPADGVTGPRLIYWDGTQWKLSKEKGLQAGNVDWKGWYVNGKPTKVLTWRGTASRYGLNYSPASFSPDIYQNGSMFAIAPNPVLAAALIKDGNGVEWLVALCANGGNIVYIRPNTKKLSAAMYDPAKNPEGWRQIGNIEQDIVVDRAWSFNGSGNEAQVVSAPSGDKARRKVNIQFAADGNAQAVFTSVSYVSTNLYSDITNNPDPVVVNSASPCADGHFSTNYKETLTYDSSHYEGSSQLLAVDYMDHAEILAEQRVKYGRDNKANKITVTNSEVFNVPPDCDLIPGHSYIQNHLPEVLDFSYVMENTASRTENIGVNGVELQITLQKSSGTESQVEHASVETRCGPNGQCVTTKVIEYNVNTIRSSFSENNNYYLDLPDLRASFSILYRQSRKEIDSATPVYTELLEIKGGGSANAYTLATQVGIPAQCHVSGGCQDFGKLPYTPPGYQAGFGQDVNGRVIYVVQARNQIAAPVGKATLVNFLTNGGLETLIPPGSGEANYTFIGVVK